MSATDTETRILDATIEALARHGLTRLTLEDVAGLAGVSRQTVYRYFGNRDALISATILREEGQLIAKMAAATEGHAELRSALEAAIGTALREARAHPLLDRILETEPEALLPYLAMGTGPVLSAATPVVRDLLARYLPDHSDAELARVSEATTRLIVSYAISPVIGDTDEVAAGLAEMIAHGVASRVQA